MRRLAWIGLALAAGCDCPRLVITTDGPDQPAWVAALFETAAGTVVGSSAFARWDPASPSTVSLTDVPAPYLRLVFYDDASVGTLEGRTPEVRSSPDQLLLPPPIWNARGGPRESCGFTVNQSTAPVPPLTAEGWLPPPVCHDFVAEAPPAFVTRDETNFRFGLPLGDDRAVLGFDSNVGGPVRIPRMVAVSRGGSPLDLHLSTDTPARAAFVTDPGELWLVGAELGVHRGALSNPLVLTATTPRKLACSDTGEMALVGSTGSSAFELYAAADTGTFERYDGRVWTVLADRSEGCSMKASGGIGAAWIGPLEAIAVGAFKNPMGEDCVLHYREGLVACDSLGLGSDVLQSAGKVEGVGVVVGTQAGVIFRWDPELARWQELFKPSALTKAYAYAPIGLGGLLIGGGGKSTGNPTLSEFEPTAVCGQTSEVFGDHNIKLVLARGPMRYLLGGTSSHGLYTQWIDIR